VSTELADDVGAGRVELSTIDDSEASTSARITGARRQLRRVIRNLVDNAIRHGGSVGVGRAPIGGARFTVALPLSLPPAATP
jgi:signal transduction histidine kinase